MSARPVATDTRHGLDRLVVNGRRVFGWGWAADRSRAEKEIELGLEGDGWH